MEPVILAICIATAVVALAGAVCALCALLAVRKQPRNIADGVAEEVKRQVSANSEAMLGTLRLQTQTIETRLAQSESAAAQWRQEIDARTAESTRTLQEGARAERQEMAAAMEALRQQMGTAMEGLRQAVSDNLARSLDLTASRMDAVRQEVANQLKELRDENRRALDEMRGVVDKQLHENLEARLSQSFALITDKLQQVYQGLGEMQSLSTGMQDLKRVLSGVKTRGMWGELSLRSLLEDILTPDQYVCDYRPRGDRSAVVEFAIKLPGQGEHPVYLPIDSKFPMEDYERLVAAAEAGDKEALARSQAALTQRLKAEAKDIATKYIDPPQTTDFAILYLPIEGLFAEVTRTAGLVEQLRRTYKVIVAGPTTLTALLNSLQVGFRTMAIEKRSRELWQLLESFRGAFDKFAADLAKAEKQLGTAMGTLQDTSRRTARISKQLQQVATLQLAGATPDEAAVAACDLLPDDDTGDDI